MFNVSWSNLFFQLKIKVGVKSKNFLQIVGNYLRLLLLSILIGSLITACNQEISPNSASNNNLSRNEDCQVIQHGFGQTSLCGKPQRVVALGPNILDSLLALEVQPAGYAEIAQFQRGDFDNPSTQIPYLGKYVKTKPVNIGVSSQPSFELLQKLQPDLIIGGVGANEDEYNFLTQIAPTILVNNRTTDRWQDSILILAQALQKEDKAQAVIAEYNQKIELTKTKLASVVNQYPKILIISGDLKQIISLSNEISYSGRLLSSLGFKVVSPPELKDQKNISPISFEILPQLDADQILIQGVNMDIKDFIAQKLGWGIDNFEQKLTDQQLTKVKRKWQENAIAQKMRASQEDRVYFMTYYLWNGLRGPLGTEIILDELRQLLL